MDRLKRVLHTVFFPPRPWGIGLGLAFLAFVGAVFLLGKQGEPIAYAAYLLSAYGLYLLIMATVVPLCGALRKKLRSLPRLQRYYTEPAFRARVSLYRSIAVNVLYALFKLVTGILTGSAWVISVAIYYAAVILVKLVLVRENRRAVRAPGDSLREWKVYRVTGALLMLLDLTLSGIIFQVVWRGESYRYPGTVIFLMAGYAFYRITVAVLRVVRGRKERGPLVSAARAIDLTIAIVALFTLQTAMLQSFGKEDALFISLFNSITGIAAMAAVLGIATFLIVHGARHSSKPHPPRRRTR